MSDGPDLYRITQHSKYLWAVELAHPIHGWISVADCLLPWVDVMRITQPIRMDAAPTPKGVRPFGAGVKGACEWCGQNPHRYLAVSDGGAQYICEVCATDVKPSVQVVQ